MEGVTEAGKASAPAGAGEKTTPTATPSTQPGPSNVAAATGQEEEVKPKPAEKKTEVSSWNFCSKIFFVDQLQIPVGFNVLFHEALESWPDAEFPILLL